MNLFNFFRKSTGLGLALGGGNIRGLAHIGVLKVLEKHNIKISCISGTSAGAIIAALYASGLKVKEIQEIAYDLDWVHLVRPHFSFKGVFTSRKIQELLEMKLLVKEFGATKIPLAISTTDLISGKEYVFHKAGESIPLAVRASCSVPGLFAPVSYKNMHLVDGCLVNNVPLSLLEPHKPQYKIGINVIPAAGLKEAHLDLVTVISRANDLYQLTALRLSADSADLILEPIKEYISVIKQGRKLYDQLIIMGEKEAEKHLLQLKKYGG